MPRRTPRKWPPTFAEAIWTPMDSLAPMQRSMPTPAIESPRSGSPSQKPSPNRRLPARNSLPVSASATQSQPTFSAIRKDRSRKPFPRFWPNSPATGNRPTAWPSTSATLGAAWDSLLRHFKSPSRQLTATLVRDWLRSLRKANKAPLTLEHCQRVKAARLCVRWPEELSLPWAETARRAAAKHLTGGRWSARLKSGTRLSLS